MKKRKIIVAVIAAAVLVSALAAGIIFGKTFMITQNQLNQNSTLTEEAEIIMPTDIYNLVKALDDYLSADIQQAEIVFKIESKAFAIDEAVSVQAGQMDGNPIAHIKKGMIDAYIYNDKLYLEDEAELKIAGIEFSPEDIDVKEMLELIYALAKNGEFIVSEIEGQTVYRIVLSQQQIEQLIGENPGSYDTSDIILENGELCMVIENRQLAGVDIICDGFVYILGFERPLTASVNVQTSAVNGGEISVPKSMRDKMQ